MTILKPLTHKCHADSNRRHIAWLLHGRVIREYSFTLDIDF